MNFYTVFEKLRGIFHFNDRKSVNLETENALLEAYNAALAQETKKPAPTPTPPIRKAPTVNLHTTPSVCPPMYVDDDRDPHIKYPYEDEGVEHYRKQEYKEAIDCFVHAIVDYCSLRSMRLLGNCYKYGYGVEQDIAMAKDLYEDYYSYASIFQRKEPFYIQFRKDIDSMNVPVYHELRKCVEGIGNVRVVKSPHCYMATQVRYNQNEILVTVDKRRALLEGLWYAEKHIPKLNREWTADGKNRFYDGYTINADHYRLQVKRGTTNRYISKIDGRELLLLFPKDACLDYIYVQVSILKKVKQLLDEQAKIVIPEVLQRVSQRINVPYNTCKVTRVVAECAACNRGKQNDIYFRTYCVQLTAEKLDALCIHELTHNFVSGHGTDFKEKMIQLGGEEMLELDKRLWKDQQWPWIL